MGGNTDTVPAQLRAARVTRREAEVLRALGDGLSNAAVAMRLCISVRTVESHVGSLLAKLGVHDRRGLAEIARCLPSPPSASTVLPGELHGSVQGPPLVGRGSDLALLRRRLEEVRRHERRVVVVTGEAGCGKSRLVAELAVEAAGSGTTVVLGHCDQHSGLAYQPFVEAISTLADARPAAVGRADPVVPAELVHLVPALGRIVSRRNLVGGGEHVGSRARLFEGVAALLATVAAEAPVLLVVEDLHQADEGSLHLLRHLVRRVDRSALLVAVTVRGTRLEGPALPIVDELRRRHGADVLCLGGLSLDDLAVLVLADRHLGPSRPGRHRELAAALWARTEGNPFLVAEVLRQVHAEGPQALTGSGVPVAVRDLVATRLADLGEPVATVLAVAALVGRRFPLDVVAVAASLGEEDLVAALEPVERVGLVRAVPDRPGWLEFTHDLVREAVEAELSALRRRVLHRRVADALAGRDGALAGAVAQHLAAAEPRDGAAVTAAVAAAEEADRYFAYESAAGFYAAAGGLLSQRDPGPSPLRIQLLLREAAAHRRAGALAAAAGAARQALGLARELGDPLAVADAALALTEAAPTLPSDPSLPEVVRQALSGLPRHEVGRRARLMARMAQSAYYLAPVDERRVWSDRALTAARTSGDDGTLAAVLAARHAALWAGADAPERLGVAQELLAIAGRLDDPELALQGRAWEVVDRLELGDVAGADRAIAGHARIARRLGQPLAVRDGALWAAMRAILDGRFDDAERESSRALLLGDRADDPHARMYWWVQRYWLVLERGGPRDELTQLVDVYEELADRYRQVPAWVAKLALLHVRLGERDRARELAGDLAADRFARLPPDAVWLAGLRYLTEVAVALGDRDQARVLYGLLRPHRDRLVVVDRALLCLGSVELPLGLLASALGDAPAATRHLRAALDVHRRIGAGALVRRTGAAIAP